MISYPGNEEDFKKIEFIRSEDSDYATPISLDVNRPNYHKEHSWTLEKDTADCGTDGEKISHCECGATKYEDSKATGKHVKDAGKKVNATCESKGSITYNCVLCGKSIQTDMIEPLGHRWDKGTINANGKKLYKCLNPNCKKTKTEVPSLKKGDVVTVDKTKDKVKILSTKKKEVSFVSVRNKKKTKIVLSDKVRINGVPYKITEIESKAFKGNRVITKVTIPATVKAIGKEAFFGCRKLKTVVIKSKKLTNKTVGKNAFMGLAKDAIIKVPKTKWKAYKNMLKKKGISGKDQKIAK